MDQDRDRRIEILELTKRICAEIDSGRVEDVDMDQERIDQIRSMLFPPPGGR